MTTIDFDYLEKNMYFTRTDMPQEIFRIELADLLDKHHARKLVEQYGLVLKALKPEVAATYFSLWFGWICAALQYTISHHDAAYDLSLRNLGGQVFLFNERPRWAFQLHDIDSVSVPQGDRSAWRKRMLTSFYADQVTPVLAAVSAAAGIGVGQLWGQLATRLHYAQDAWLREAANVRVRQTIEEDFAYLQYELGADVFDRKRNPFDINFRQVDNPRIPGETLRIKASCCLAYLTDTGHGYCYTCPRMGEDEREQYRQRLATTVQA
jgi:ferric iron reductase protein FhuF